MEHAPAHRNTDGEPKGTLYVVATPIGNLRDISPRALDVLKSVAVIAAEDTRVTSKLLGHYGITAKLTALHEHNEKRATQRLVALLAEGRSVALVSDAGTPAISDPGAHLVGAARAAGCIVTPVPGANAAVAALSAAGLATPHFLFYGFLPQRAAERRRELARLAVHRFAMVFYEAPHRVADCIADMSAAFGAIRRIVIARELTKLFETIHVCALGEALDWIESDDNRRKGEFVLIVEGAAQRVEDASAAQRVLEILLAELPLKQAVALVTRITGAKRNELYALALQLKGIENGE
ncbi:MAG: 16S rRNA (cytidine(1402)-2'-O)-methyltransferase [Betaproteobacteria bacterium RIFCSPLOWO2_12_FULL_62_13]|nr:MAG: 16S rRNA (cytidine(1402)-2'-O)-methyltransferase [Betaproteobacteria bacterium RIFCSPLOWO2_12_FULL_62_13]